MIYLQMSALPFNYYFLLFSNCMFSVGNHWQHLLFMEPEMASPDKKGLQPPLSSHGICGGSWGGLAP